MGQRSWKKGEGLELIELPTPSLRAGELRVAVKAIGVNPVDWKMREKGPLRLAARFLGAAPPIVVGVDFAGVVEALGPDVTRFVAGARVVGGTNFARKQRGSYADTVVVREDQLATVPEGVDLETAGALPVAGVTAYMSIVELGRIRRFAPGGERRVLVLGASGGVGQLAVQFAKIEKAFVVGVCSQKNAGLVRSLGADEVLDYAAGDPLEAARAQGPYAIVVDCAGGYSARRCRSLLRRGGRHVMVAGDTPLAMLQALVPPFSSRIILGRPTVERLDAVMSAVAAGTLHVAIAKKFPLAEAEAALALSRTSRMTGKILLIP